MSEQTCKCGRHVEEWRAVPDAHGYEVSSFGRIRSWIGPGGIGGIHSLPTPQIKALSMTSDGYHRANIARKTRIISHVVALTFLGERPDGAQIRHLNGDSTDDRLCNLAYGSRSQNTLDSVGHGTHNQASKTHCKHGHEFTPENTYYRRTGGRRCRTCQNAASNAHLRRKAVA